MDDTTDSEEEEEESYHTADENDDDDDDDDDDAKITRQYTNPSSKIAFSGISNIKRYFPHRTEEQIKDVLAGIPTYTLHREAKKVKTRNPFFIYERRQQIQMDLIDMSNLKKWNDGTTFLLVAIDCATKKAWVRRLQNKSAQNTLAAIKSIIEAMHTPPRTVFFDRGTVHLIYTIRYLTRMYVHASLFKTSKC
jgi:hypothetical protein